MNARFEVGELVDVQIKGARIEDTAGQGFAPLLALAVDGERLEIALSAGVTVTRVAPKEWPPQPGDVWEGADGTQFFARSGEPGDPGWLADANRETGSSYPDEILASFGPLRLAYRRGWSPEPAPVAVEDEPVKLDKRAEMIAGLRELASWLEAHPGAPLPYDCELRVYPQNGPSGRLSNDEALVELLRIADSEGLRVSQHGPHVLATNLFRGGVHYDALVCDVELAHASADDVTGAGEEAAGPDGAGPAAAPTEGSLGMGEEVGGARSANEQEAPPTGQTTEQVWVATVRQGIAYHRPESADRTVCGRSTRSGGLIGLTEAVALAGEACKRCYPDGHDVPGGAA